MDVATAAAVVAAFYPILKDTALLVLSARGSLSADYKKNLNQMVTASQKDIVDIKEHIEDMRSICSELNLQTGERGAIPWSVPHNANAFLRWKYRRVARKLHGICEDFSSAMDGITATIACCMGILENTETSQNITPSGAEEPWMKDLSIEYQDMMEKVQMPQNYSIDELTNGMDRFLDRCRGALQNLSRSLG